MICKPTSPHQTRNMKPTTLRLAQKVLRTGTRSRFASLISAEICFMKAPCISKRASATTHSPKLEAQLSKKDSPLHRQIKQVNTTAKKSKETLIMAQYSRLRLVDGKSSTFRTSCSVERYSRVKMRRLSHWKMNWRAYKILLIVLYSVLVSIESVVS